MAKADHLKQMVKELEEKLFKEEEEARGGGKEERVRRHARKGMSQIVRCRGSGSNGSQEDMEAYKPSEDCLNQKIEYSGKTYLVEKDKVQS